MVQRHYVGKKPVRCCTCNRQPTPEDIKHGEPRFYWQQVPVGGDGYAEECPECADAHQQQMVEEYEDTP
jgi:hypothetical protein